MPPDRIQILAEAIYSGGSLHFRGFHFIPDRELSEREKESKGARREEEGRGRGENRRINPFSTPDLRSSSIMPLFISLFVFLDRSMTCE